jgi:hypothetical protein
MNGQPSANRIDRERMRLTASRASFHTATFLQGIGAGDIANAAAKMPADELL